MACVLGAYDEFVDVGRVPVLAGWEDLPNREERAAVHPGDPIMLAPDYRVDELLSEYLCRSSFVHLEHETKRNYTSDYRVFFDFLWDRGKIWTQASSDDLLDFHDWRVRSPRNPGRVGGAKWNRAGGAVPVVRLGGATGACTGESDADPAGRGAVRGDGRGSGRAALPSRSCHEVTSSSL